MSKPIAEARTLDTPAELGFTALRRRGLRRADEWTPSARCDDRLSRLITYIETGAAGETITYIDRNGDAYSCQGQTFRDWISKMRCVWRHDYEVSKMMEA